MKVVLDTNVLLSLWVFADSRYSQIRHAAEAGQIELLTNADCLAEFRRVLGYPEFALDNPAQQRAFDAYGRIAQKLSTTTAPRKPLPACRDRDDQKFLELALDGNVRYLVTNDKALLALAKRKPLKEYFSILTPQHFMEIPALCDSISIQAEAPD
ncbi:MAG: putative toxin-antitoxin system toxin component, PIN family [Betaproteobacteria bacterium]|nr:putative toxin-antitoxin system toxin component, PIN family [Betaproteobacteria bacterium]